MHYDEPKIAELMNDPGIIRNRLKIDSIIRNASVYLQISAETGSFSDYLWSFVGARLRLTIGRHVRMSLL